jgi:hypothetical protein
MIRVSMVVTAVLCLMACNNGSDDEKRARSARAEANDRSGAALKEADEKIKSAQAQAEDTISAVRMDFKALREDFRHTTASDLIDLDDKVDGLTVQATQSSGKEKTERDAKLKQIHTSRDAFWTDCQSVESATESTWDATKARLEREWTELKALVARA